MGGCCGAMKTGQKSLPDKTHAKNSGDGNQEKSNGKEPLLQAATNSSKASTPVEANAQENEDTPHLQEEEKLLASVKVSVNDAEPLSVGATEEEPVQESKNFMDLETSVVPFENFPTNDQLPPEAAKSFSSAELEARVSYEIPVEHVFTSQQGESRQQEVQLTTSFSAPPEDPLSTAVKGTLLGQFDAEQSTDFKEDEEVIPKPQQIQNLELIKDVIGDAQPPAEIQFQQEFDLTPIDEHQKGDTIDSVGHFQGGDFDVPLIVSGELEPNFHPSEIIAICPPFFPKELETTAEISEQVSLEAEASTFQVQPQELNLNLEPVSQRQLIDLELASGSDIAAEEKADTQFEVPELEMAPNSEPISKEPADLALVSELNTTEVPYVETAAPLQELSHGVKPSEELNTSAVETYELIDAPKSELEGNPAGNERQEPVEELRQDFVEQSEQEPVKEVIPVHEEEVGQAPADTVNQEPVEEIKQELDEEEKRLSAQIVEQVTAEAVLQASLKEEDETKVVPSEAQPPANDPAAPNENALMDDWSILSAQEIQSSDVSVEATETVVNQPVLETEKEPDLDSQIPEEVSAEKSDEVSTSTSAAPVDEDQTAYEKLVSFDEQQWVDLPPETLSKEGVEQNTEDAVDLQEKEFTGEPDTHSAMGTTEGGEALQETEVRVEAPLQSDFLGETVFEEENSTEKYTEHAPYHEQRSQEPSLEEADQVQKTEDTSLEPPNSDQQPEESLVKATEQEQTSPELYQEQRPEEKNADQLQQVDDVPHAEHNEKQPEEQPVEQEPKEAEEPNAEQIEQEQQHLEQHVVDQESQPQKSEDLNVEQVSAALLGLSDQQPVQSEATEAAEAEAEQNVPVLELVSEATQHSRDTWWQESGKEADDDVPILESLPDQARQAREIWWEEAAGSHEQPQAEEAATAAAVEEGACPQPSGDSAADPLVQDENSTTETPQPIPSSESQQNGYEGVNEEVADTVTLEVVPEPLPPFPSADQTAESVPDGVPELTKDLPVVVDDSPLSSAGIDGTSSTIPTENGEMSPKSSDDASTSLSPEAGESTASMAAAAAVSKEAIPTQA